MHASGITNAKNAKLCFGLKPVTAACFVRTELWLVRRYKWMARVAVNNPYQQIVHHRHARAGGNPAKTKTSYTKYFEQKLFILKALDSRLRGNDGAVINNWKVEYTTDA
jgi:hypothetical protein